MPSLPKIHTQYFQALPVSHLLQYRPLHDNTPTAATLAVSGTVQHYTVTMVHAIILPADPGMSCRHVGLVIRIQAMFLLSAPNVAVRKIRSTKKTVSQYSWPQDKY
jgi:hypothetical protein